MGLGFSLGKTNGAGGSRFRRDQESGKLGLENYRPGLETDPGNYRSGLETGPGNSHSR